MFNNILRRRKGQAAINYLLLIGGAVLISVIVIGVVIGISSSSKKSTIDSSEKLQLVQNQTGDISSIPSIVEITPIPDSCLNSGTGRFNLKWNPNSTGGAYSIIVKDYYDNILDVTSDTTSTSSLSTDVLDDNITLHLDTYNNLCTDTFYVTIKETKDNFEFYSKKKQFSWTSSASFEISISGNNPETINEAQPLSLILHYDNNSGPVNSWSVDSNKGESLGLLGGYPNFAIIPILWAGVHDLTISASDGTTTAIAHKIVNVMPNSSYTVTITSPSNGASFILGDTINFNESFSGEDPHGPETCNWKITKEGSTYYESTECSFLKNFTETGTYKVDLNTTSYDVLSKASATQVNFTVNSSSTPLSAYIVSLNSGDNYYLLEDQNFYVDITGGVSPYSCRWRIENGGPGRVFSNDCNFTDTWKALGFSNGNYDISITVTDRESNIKKDLVENINIVDAPNLILAPMESKYVNAGEGDLYFVADTNGFSNPHCNWYINDTQFTGRCFFSFSKNEILNYFNNNLSRLSLKIDDVNFGSRDLNIVNSGSVPNHIILIDSPTTGTILKERTDFKIRSEKELNNYTCKWYYKKYGASPSVETLFKSAADCRTFQYKDLRKFTNGTYVISVVLYDNSNKIIDTLNVYPIIVK